MRRSYRPTEWKVGQWVVQREMLRAGPKQNRDPAFLGDNLLWLEVGKGSFSSARQYLLLAVIAEIRYCIGQDPDVRCGTPLTRMAPLCTSKFRRPRFDRAAASKEVGAFEIGLSS